MDQKTNLRHLHILQYLYERTDDEHPASTADITEYLAEKGMAQLRVTHLSIYKANLNMKDNNSPHFLELKKENPINATSIGAGRQGTVLCPGG